MLGVFLGALSAATFAFNSAALRRGVLTGSVSQALAVTVSMGVPLFFTAALLSGALAVAGDFAAWQVELMMAIGVLHFVGGRYCNYRAAQAIGSNLSGPLIQLNLVVTLVLAIGFLQEVMTPLRVLGIALVVFGPLLVRQGPSEPRPQAVNAGIEAGGWPAFSPRYAEGYVFSLLCALIYGTTPIGIRLVVESGGPRSSLVAGLIAYSAATAVIVLFLLLRPPRLREVLAMKTESLKWFTFSGVFVCLSQMFLYLAYSVAPVSVVTPVLQLQLILRYLFANMLNPDHEVRGGGMILATVVSLIGALALSLSTEFVLSMVSLPDGLVEILRWQWP